MAFWKKKTNYLLDYSESEEVNFNFFSSETAFVLCFAAKYKFLF